MPNYRRLFIQNSYVFLTVVTNNRRPILIDNVDLLRESFKRTKVTYKFEIIAAVILPDHTHLMLHPENINEYPKIIRAIKYNFTQLFKNGGIAIPPYINLRPNINSRAGLPSCRQRMWQNRYFEHTIRDEQDLNNHLDYIHYNPVKHGLIKNVKDWEFSSFHKFVEQKSYEPDWGSYEDIKNISELNYDR